MIAYEGVRTSSGARVYRVDGNMRAPLRHRIVYHSPTGFEWGYAGSGPADLALNILADVAGWNGTWEGPSPVDTGRCTCGAPIWRSEDGAWVHDTDDEESIYNHEPTLGTGRMLPKWVFGLHQQFKFDVIADAERQGFRLEEDEILSWLALHGLAVSLDEGGAPVA